MYKSSFAKLSMAVYMIVLFAASIPSNLYAEVLNPTENSQLPTYTLLEPLPCLDGSNASDCAKGTQINNINFQEYIAYVFNLIIALAAVTAVFMIVWGGFQYMSTDSYSGKTEGLNKLKNAVYGLLLVLSSYLILQTIDPRLVKIPTTLVKPLNIQYKPDEVANWMQQIQSDAAILRNQNMNLTNQVSETYKKINELDKQKASLNSQLGELLYDIGVADNDPRVLELKKQIVAIEYQQNDLRVKDSIQTSTGRMNAIMQECYGITTDASVGAFKQYGSGLNVSYCVEQIEKIKKTYVPILESAGNGLAAQSVRDYATYSESMARINGTILTNMSQSQDIVALVDTLQSTVTAAGIGVGAAYGGTVGATSGAIISQFASAVIKSAQLGQSQQAAKVTVSEIQLEINNTAKSITDDELRKIYTAHAYTLIKSLGGRGDGTDTTDNATSKKSNWDLNKNKILRTE